MKDEKQKLKKKGFPVDIGYVGYIKDNNTQVFATEEEYNNYIDDYNQSLKKNDSKKQK